MRTATITKTFYTFDELSDDAKAKAIEDNRDWNVDGLDWWDAVYEDFKRVCTIMGVDVDDMSFTGFWSQGDGASFIGSYGYKPGALNDIMAYAPKDEDLHALCKRLQDVQRRWFYGLTATITRMAHGGNYVHSNTMTCEVWSGIHDMCVGGDDEAEVLDVMRRLADWLYDSLEREYEYLTSDEAVQESLEANEMEFTEDGYDA